MLTRSSCHTLPHPKILLRALRDFNLGKLTSDDTSIFVGLLNDLFPKTLELVPRAREVDFEAKVRNCMLGGPWPRTCCCSPWGASVL